MWDIKAEIVEINFSQLKFYQKLSFNCIYCNMPHRPIFPFHASALTHMPMNIILMQLLIRAANLVSRNCSYGKDIFLRLSMGQFYGVGYEWMLNKGKSTST